MIHNILIYQQMNEHLHKQKCQVQHLNIFLTTPDNWM